MIKSGFITQNGAVELPQSQLLEYAREYCKEMSPRGFDKFSPQYPLGDPAYEYVLRFLKWIQIGTTFGLDDSYLVASESCFDIHELDSSDYGFVEQKKGKIISSMPFISALKVCDLDRNFILDSGFILDGHILVNYGNYYHLEIAETLANYITTYHKEIGEFLKHYDTTCYEDIFTRLLGFPKVGSYRNMSIVVYTPEIATKDEIRLVKDYGELGFQIQEVTPIDKSLSKKFKKGLKF